MAVMKIERAVVSDSGTLRREDKQNKVFLESLGCKLNQAEVESWARHFAERGLRLALRPEEADVHVINTCAVTHVAEHKSRQLVRQARRMNPGVTLVVAGCFVDRSPNEVLNLGADIGLGNTDKGRLADLLGLDGDQETPASSGMRTRAFVKIQEGCSDFCTYCLVPRLRGLPRSRPVEQVLADVRSRVDDGYREVVLSGNQLGSYDGGVNMSGLVRRIISETDIERLRISSLQPQDIDDDLLDLWVTETRLCPHLHVPLQSGSKTVLERMRRRYSLDDYRQKVELLRQASPNIAITTDIMVGFPGETQAEFEDSHQFCADMNFADMHVFPFSPRPGTQASRMPDQKDAATKKERSRAMIELGGEMSERYQSLFLGQTLRVLWEENRSLDGNGDVWIGHSGNYIKMYCRSSADLRNQLHSCRPIALADDGLWVDVGDEMKPEWIGSERVK
jgi:threonylcarbamoyladenosine tRNA methylthiotransferase MtaB